jgi:transcriptional regulator with XRE-family HTH domain
MSNAYDDLLKNQDTRFELLLDQARVNVANLLATLLEEQKMSQKEFAEKIGVSEGRVTQILGGNANLQLSTIVKALGAFDRSLEVNSRPLFERPATGCLKIADYWQNANIGAKGRYRWPATSELTTNNKRLVGLAS